MNATIIVTPPRRIARRHSRASGNPVGSGQWAVNRVTRHSRASGNPVGHCWASRQRRPAWTLAAAALILLLAPNAAAQETRWRAGTGDWFEPANWTAGVPTTSKDAVIDNGGTAQIASPGAAPRHLFVGKESPNPSLLKIVGGGTLDNSPWYRAYLGYGPGSHGIVTISGGGSTWTDRSGSIVGNYGAGTLTIEGGGQVSSSSVTLSYFPNSQGTATVTGSGSELTIATSLSVGLYGTGTVNIEDGGHVLSTRTHLGYLSGSQGTATVTGVGSQWTNSAELYVGFQGAGTLTVADGGLVSAGTLHASLDHLLGNGTITVKGAVLDAEVLFDGMHGMKSLLEFGAGGTLNIDADGSGHLGAGYRATGILVISNAAQVASRTGHLGYWPGSQGTATVVGNGSRWTNSGDLHVGREGAGNLNIERGGQMSNTGNAFLGSRPGSYGTVTLTGSGSSWTSPSWLYVGNSGFGTLHIADGAQASNTNTCIGRYSGSQGTVTVSGAGSKWTGSACTVGLSGIATLNIENGAEVSNGAVRLGDASSSHGKVTVTGSESKWRSSSLNVGNYGAGTVVVADGGQMSNENCRLGYYFGSQGTVTVSGASSKWTNSWSLTVGREGIGSLNIEDGGWVSGHYGYLGYASGSEGTAMVTGSPSTWTNSSELYVGRAGLGMLSIQNGGQVSNTYGYLGYASGSQGTATVTGTGSKWTNSWTIRVGDSGTGTLHIADGGVVIAKAVSINNKSLLAIDVGQGSLLTVGSTGTGTITNNGTVRILAGAGAIGGAEYAPIVAGTWAGTGSYVGVGGTWNAASRRFVASEVEQGTSGAPILIDLAQRQRVLIDDGPTGWSLGASFPAKTDAATQLTFTAAAASGSILGDLLALIEPGQIVWGAWELAAAGSGYSPGDPVYLSFDVGAGFSPSDLSLWHHDGLQWSPFAAPDLSYNGQYAGFTVTSLSAYAVAAVPEPGTWAMLAALAVLVGLGSLARHWRRRVRCKGFAVG
jgi:T5SS/PEP-CTERM-associated repeat protein